MARTTSAEVQKIIDVDAAVTDLTPFITAANELVTEACTGDSQGYSATRLQVIETWLAAHLVAIRDPHHQSEGAGGVTARYQGQTGFNFQSTYWGQQALLLDTAGGLAALSEHTAKGKRARVGATWLGTDLSTTDYEDE
jgi:hypothetical protein